MLLAVEFITISSSFMTFSIPTSLVASFQFSWSLNPFHFPHLSLQSFFSSFFSPLWPAAPLLLSVSVSAHSPEQNFLVKVTVSTHQLWLSKPITTAVCHSETPKNKHVFYHQVSRVETHSKLGPIWHHFMFGLRWVENTPLGFKRENSPGEPSSVTVGVVFWFGIGFILVKMFVYFHWFFFLSCAFVFFFMTWHHRNI